MKLTHFEKEFEPVARMIGGVYLLSDSDALRFVDRCEQDRVDILCVEGFRFQDDRIQPLQEHSFDLERIVSGNHIMTRHFIAQRIGGGLWFEIVTSDRTGETVIR
jgi:hypothetical protein